MAGENSLALLISSMRPHLNEGDYVFCTLDHPDAARGIEVLGSFREAEGLTVIVERGAAQQAGLAFDYVAAWITLNGIAGCRLDRRFRHRIGQCRHQLQRARRVLPRPYLRQSRGCRSCHASALESVAQRRIARRQAPTLFAGDRFPGMPTRQAANPNDLIMTRAESMAQVEPGSLERPLG